eukprot:m.170697 g.170697  ORF g.170697 m.170697 type:complete len:815 (+) comp17254_c0_seq3:452-2896(+)
MAATPERARVSFADEASASSPASASASASVSASASSVTSPTSPHTRPLAHLAVQQSNTAPDEQVKHLQHTVVRLRLSPPPPDPTPDKDGAGAAAASSAAASSAADASSARTSLDSTVPSISTITAPSSSHSTSLPPASASASAPLTSAASSSVSSSSFASMSSTLASLSPSMAVGVAVGPSTYGSSMSASKPLLAPSPTTSAMSDSPVRRSTMSSVMEFQGVPVSAQPFFVNPHMAHHAHHHHPPQPQPPYPNPHSLFHPYGSSSSPPSTTTSSPAASASASAVFGAAVGAGATTGAALFLHSGEMSPVSDPHAAAMFAEADMESASAGSSFDILSIRPEDFARQLSLLDLTIFKLIKKEELMDDAWISKDKFSRAENVVNFTRRFNHVAFWVAREVLYARSADERSRRLSHFIKMAKRLYAINNFHSMMAIISGLRSAPIYRLTQTWKMLRSADAAVFEKLESLTSSEGNNKAMRDQIAAAKLPCIPYLGLYLTDLTHINVASRQGQDAEREAQKRRIIEEIQHFQKSEYNFDVVSFIRDYLLSLRYKEELVKLMEQNNYRLSLQLEPKQESGSNASEEKAVPKELGIKQQQANNMSLLPTMSLPFRLRGKDRGHRKTMSLGAGTIFTETNRSEAGSRAALDAGSEQGSCEAESPLMRGRDDSGSSDDESPSVSSIRRGSSSFNSADMRDHVVKEGPLRKKSRSLMHSYRRHWAVLSKKTLYLFKTPKMPHENMTHAHIDWRPVRSIPLEGATLHSDFLAKKPVFEITTADGVAMKFLCDTDDDCADWQRALESVINSCARRMSRFSSGPQLT